MGNFGEHHDHFLQQDFDPKNHGHYGSSTAHYAAEFGNLTVIFELVKNGYDCNKSNFIVHIGFVESIRFILHQKMITLT